MFYQKLFGLPATLLMFGAAALTIYGYSEASQGLVWYGISTVLMYSYSSFLLRQARRAFNPNYNPPASLLLRCHPLGMDVTSWGFVDAPVTRGVLLKQRLLDLLPVVNTLMMFFILVAIVIESYVCVRRHPRVRAWLRTPA